MLESGANRAQSCSSPAPSPAYGKSPDTGSYKPSDSDLSAVARYELYRFVTSVVYSHHTFIVFWTAAAATLFDAARIQKPRDLQTEMPSSRPLSFQFWYEHILWYEHSFLTLIFEGDDFVRRFLRLPSCLSCAAFLEVSLQHVASPDAATAV